jgi:hypothetical protein
MFTKTSLTVTFVLTAIIVIGMLVVMNGVDVNVNFPTAHQCYNQLNAAGQVVGSFCQ